MSCFSPTETESVPSSREVTISSEKNELSSQLLSSSTMNTSSNQISSTATLSSNTNISSSFTQISSSSIINENLLIDSRDNQKYKTVKIGSQKWMAENLRYLPAVNSYNEGGWGEKNPYYYIYDYTPTEDSETENLISAFLTSNYSTLGVLYNWSAALDSQLDSDNSLNTIQGACPGNWHIPSAKEWEELFSFVKKDASTSVDAKLLKATTGWDNGGDGDDFYGFSVIPAGMRYNSAFAYRFTSGDFWTSTPSNSTRSKYVSFQSNATQTAILEADITNGLSIRCVEN